MDWFDFYKKRVNSSYQRYFEFRYFPLLNYILQQDPTEILEIGCGIGSVSKFLKNYNIKCSGIDLCEKMVSLATENTNGEVEFKQQNILNFSSNKLCISHGVLEHFDDFQIKRILMLYPNSIHYVPTNKYTEASFGDERLLPYEYWLDNFKITEYKLFNDNKDLIFKV